MPICKNANESTVNDEKSLEGISNHIAFSDYKLDIVTATRTPKTANTVEYIEKLSEGTLTYCTGFSIYHITS